MPLWPAKKDQKEDQVQIEIPDPPGATGVTPGATGVTPVPRAGEAPDQLGQLCARLGQLGVLLSQTNQQVLAYLVEQQSNSSGPMANDRATVALAEKIDGFSEKLGQLDAKLERLAERLAPQQPDQLAEPAPAPVCGPVIGPPGATGVTPVSLAGDDWQRALLGSDLAEYPGLDFQRQQLLAGVSEGDAGACSLLGQLLIFRSAAADKMPPLLKDIGEAYYRWQPKTRPGSSPMEKALAAWLKEALQDVGIANTIELVEPGERFDSTRHTASTRGVEITEVRGWIVLRDNGKVYTKANVAVR